MYCPDTDSVSTVPPAAKVSDVQFGRRVDPCHSPRPQPGVRKVADPLSQIQLEGNLGSTHKQKQFTNLINISDLSLVRCFVPKSEEFVSEGIFCTVSLLLRTASWSHKCDVLRFAQPCSAY